MLVFNTLAKVQVPYVYILSSPDIVLSTVGLYLSPDGQTYTGRDTEGNPSCLPSKSRQLLIAHTVIPNLSKFKIGTRLPQTRLCLLY